MSCRLPAALLVILTALAPALAIHRPPAAAQQIFCPITPMYLELNQSTQLDPRLEEELLPLVARKRTVARLLATDACDQQVQGWIRIKRAGSVIWGPRPSIATAQLPASIADHSRASVGTTILDFDIPSALLVADEQLTFEASARPAGLYDIGQDPPPSIWQDAVSVDETPLCRAAPRILGIRFNYTYPDAPSEDRGAMSEDQLRTAATMLSNLWPIPEQSHYSYSLELLPVGVLADDRTPEGMAGMYVPAFSQLDDLRWGLLPRIYYVYGFFKGDNVTGWSTFGNTGLGRGVEKDYRGTLVHEFGHMHANLPHAYGATNEVGYDISHRSPGDILKLPSFENAMGGFSRESSADTSTWISPSSYQAFFDMNGCDRALTLPNPPHKTTEVVLDYAGNPPAISIARIRDIETAPERPEPSQEGEMYLRILDEPGGLLYATKFSVPMMVSRGGLQLYRPQFRLEMPSFTSSYTIEVMQDGNRLASRSRSAHAPQVSIVSPAPGAVITNGTAVAWYASDEDSDPLTYSIEYQVSDGRQWPLATGVSSTYLELTTLELPADPAARIRVRASDGFETAVAEVGDLQNLVNHAPRVSISAPVDGEERRRGVWFVLEASAYDLEDESLMPSALTWHSALDGYLGSGFELEVSLSEGEHIISLYGTDSGGAQSSDTVLVRVVP